MRRVVRPRRELPIERGGLYRGKLAEDYDGIGQYVLVSLSSISVGAAYKARVASGDFGGGRVFPIGTPVVVHSYRGNMEVFLGNNCPDWEIFDDFNRSLAPSTWGTASSGPTYSYLGNNPVFSPLSVNGDEGVMNLDGNTFPNIFFGPSVGNTSNPKDPGPWLEEKFMFKTRFRTPSYDYDGSDGFYIMRIGTNARHFFIAPGSNNPFPGDNHGYIIGDFPPQYNFDWHPLSYYWIQWYYDAITGDSWIKVWPDGEAEPDWLIMNPPTGDDDPVRWFEIETHNLPFGISFNPADMRWDNFQFATKCSLGL